MVRTSVNKKYVIYFFELWKIISILWQNPFNKKQKRQKDKINTEDV